jgi:hypothetical protein
MYGVVASLEWLYICGKAVNSSEISLREFADMKESKTSHPQLLHSDISIPIRYSHWRVKC